MSLNELAIVVIGRNEGQRLIDCFSSLQLHTNKIVYVDSGSTDDSVAAAQRWGVSVINLDVAKPFTAARARNEGFAAATAQHIDAQYVQFIDGDCELIGGWLDTALEFIKDRSDVAVVCGRRQELYPERSVYNRLCDIEWNTPIGEAAACGGDSLIRADAFRQVGGFNADLIAGEEPELCGRLRANGWKVWRLDTDMTRHDAAMSRLSQWWRRAVRSGYAVADISRRYASSAMACSEKREVARAIFWAGILPLTIAVSGYFQPLALFAILIYPLQIGRVAIRISPVTGESWSYASFIMLAKFAQLQGILKYLYRFWRSRPIKLIEYKR